MTGAASLRRSAVAVLAAAVLVGALSGPGVAAAKKGPAATIQFGASIVVRGVRFKPRERVTVSIVADQTWKRVATANAKGSFSAEFGALAFNNCAAYTLNVVGSRGSRYKFQHPALPC